MITGYKLYVGRLEFVPSGVPRLDEFDRSHPKDFGQVAVNRDGWTNCPYVVDLYPAEDVYCCGPLGVRRLADWWKYDCWKDELTTGELWSMVGEDWVSRTLPPAPGPG